ncbi:uncharacterized protein LOC109604609 isoform X2 [Aethina tumida]|uniref:uncharacterized protein LOC109604609 isoform X2 n=1 Tax=Aethina tumida TaxID=116153 RepID=UPI0021479309|nr:uncharacterized protein LOC109604609 isoform X2 [Aethina tumida]
MIDGDGVVFDDEMLMANGTIVALQHCRLCFGTGESNRLTDHLKSVIKKRLPGTLLDITDESPTICRGCLNNLINLDEYLCMIEEKHKKLLLYWMVKKSNKMKVSLHNFLNDANFHMNYDQVSENHLRTFPERLYILRNGIYFPFDVELNMSDEKRPKTTQITKFLTTHADGPLIPAEKTACNLPEFLLMPSQPLNNLHKTSTQAPVPCPPLAVPPFLLHLSVVKGGNSSAVPPTNSLPPPPAAQSESPVSTEGVKVKKEIITDAPEASEAPESPEPPEVPEVELKFEVEDNELPPLEEQDMESLINSIPEIEIQADTPDYVHINKFGPEELKTLQQNINGTPSKPLETQINSMIDDIISKNEKVVRYPKDQNKTTDTLHIPTESQNYIMYDEDELPCKRKANVIVEEEEDENGRLVPKKLPAPKVPAKLVYQKKIGMEFLNRLQKLDKVTTTPKDNCDNEVAKKVVIRKRKVEKTQGNAKRGPKLKKLSMKTTLEKLTLPFDEEIKPVPEKRKRGRPKLPVKVFLPVKKVRTEPKFKMTPAHMNEVDPLDIGQKEGDQTFRIENVCSVDETNDETALPKILSVCSVTEDEIESTTGDN